MTREELLSLARELAQQHGESLTLTTVQRNIGISRARLLKLCGSWSQLRSAIGLSPDGPHARNSLSNETIQDKLRAAIAQHGGNITQAQFCRMTGYSTNLIEKRFGSWAQLRQSLSLAPRAKMANHYTDQEIFDDLLQVITRIHRRPTFVSYKLDGGTISSQTIRNRFGSWQKAIYAYEDELDRRSVRPQPRYREDPQNPLACYVFLCGKPLYYIVYDSPELKTGTKTPLPPDFKL
jgi:Homing endonuclease associated repeat